MSYTGSIKIINKAGWSKTVDLEKSICKIGSSGSNDIVLPQEYGSGVLPLHLQLVSPKNGSGAHRLINLTDYEYPVFDGTFVPRGALSPRSTYEIQDGSLLELGDFRLQFLLTSKKGVSIERRTENIGIRLDLPRVDLEPGKNMSGLLTLINYGEQKRCQFTLEVEGLPQDCYQVAPAPMLYPGAAEELSIRFFHRGTQPTAGPVPIQITAMAASSYPTEILTVSLVLQAAPFHQFQMTVLDAPAQGSSKTGRFTAPENLALTGIESRQNEGHEQSEKLTPHLPVQENGGSKATPSDPTGNGPAPSPAPGELPSSHNLPAASPTKNGEPGGNGSALPGSAAATEPAFVQENISDQGSNWWSQPAPVLPDRLGSLKKDIKSRLAGKDIQVIKAGLEIEEDDDETRKQN